MAEKMYYISQLWIRLFISKELSGFDIIEDDSQLFPRIDVYNRNISFSNSTSVYLTLLQFGGPGIAMTYALLFVAISQHQYDVAEKILDDLYSKFENNKQHIIQKCKKAGYIVSTQMLFLLYHEVAHGLFATDENVKTKHISRVTDSETIYSVDYTFKNFKFDEVKPSILKYIIRMIYPLRKTLKKKVYKKALDVKYKEEVACDIYAMAEWIKYAEEHVGLREFHLANLLLCVIGVYMTHTHWHDIELYIDDNQTDFYNNVDTLVMSSRKNFILLKVLDLIEHMKKDLDPENIIEEIDKIIGLKVFQKKSIEAFLYYKETLDSIKKEGVKYTSRKQRDLFKEKLRIFNSAVLELPEICPN